MTKNIIDRLKHVLNIKKDGDLAIYLNISQATLSKWKTRDSIDLPLVINAIPPNIDLNWLLRGDPVGETHVIPEPKVESLEDRVARIEKSLKGLMTKHGKTVQGLSFESNPEYHTEKLKTKENVG